MTPVIQIENVSKLYKLGFYGADTFRDEVLNFFARLRGKPAVNSLVGSSNNLSDKDSNSDYVWALKDINLTVNQGDIVGIIGKNGAGKSTLLKILSKITTPTTGSIKVRGRIASLLEVGTGMHDELTGRENIYLNGAILGMTKHEIRSKLDDIIDFAGIAKYIDTPIKRYSSGMRVRLGFAIAAHLEPEILIVDEVLAVGDAEFQKRAIGKMQDISKGEGRTVLFVSHNMGSVRALCKTGIMLENGIIVKTDTIDKAVDYYISNTNIKKTSSYVIISDTFRSKGHVGDVQFKSFRLLKDSNTYYTSESIVFQIVLHGNKTRPNCHINCSIWNAEGIAIGSAVSFERFSIRQGEDKMIEYSIHNPGLAMGFYSFSFSVGTGDVTKGLTLYDAVSNFLTIEVDRINQENYYALWKKAWGNIYFNSSLKEIQ